MLVKKFNAFGQKAYHRAEREDRSLVYRDWLRTVPANGYFLDVDMVKCKTINGEIVPCAITELTRCDSSTVGQAYLDAIIHRLFIRDKQGATIQRLADILQVPAYLVLFPKEVSWMQVYSFRAKKWRYFTPEEWKIFLGSL